MRRVFSLSAGASSEKMLRFAFAELLGQSNIPRHYTEDEPVQDASYARRQ